MTLLQCNMRIMFVNKTSYDSGITTPRNLLSSTWSNGAILFMSKYESTN